MSVTPQLKNELFSNDLLDERFIEIKNLPCKIEATQIIEIFAKYGTIANFHIASTGSLESSTAYVQFEEPSQAVAALQANLTAQIGGKPLQISIQKKCNNTPKNKKKMNDELEKEKHREERRQLFENTKNRTIYVRNITATTTEADLRQHFGACGEFETVTIIHRRPHHAFITFMSTEATNAALQLHNSILNGVSLAVFLKGVYIIDKDPNRTIKLTNKQNLKTVEVDKLRKIFSPCGEIETIEILAESRLLAFITFKYDGAVEKALLLTNTIVEGLQLAIEKYKLNLIVYVQIKTPVDQEQICRYFAECGTIEEVTIKPKYALLRFQHRDAYLKSLQLNETLLNGQTIFVRPYVKGKQRTRYKENQTSSSSKRIKVEPDLF